MSNSDLNLFQGPIPLICPGCNEAKSSIAIRPLNTAYHEDHLNYVTCCPECYQELYNYYEQGWGDYYDAIYEGIYG